MSSDLLEQESHLAEWICALWHTGSRKLKKSEIQYVSRQTGNTSSQLVDEIDFKLQLLNLCF